MASDLAIVDLVGAERERAIPVLKDSFVGIYRWHAKRQLREVDRVRAVVDGAEVVAASLLTKVAPEAGYVYYIAVASSRRRQGLGRRLLDDAIEWFRAGGTEVVYAAVEAENVASLALFRNAGLRVVEREERSYRDGGLGAYGLRRKMWVVPGEVLLGRRLRARPPLQEIADASADPSVSPPPTRSSPAGPTPGGPGSSGAGP